ncbi:PIG-L family deacetylase [Sphingobacterium shayense]|nr:PIG-L family deacetylase [Sphingobacterium shayense]
MCRNFFSLLASFFVANFVFAQSAIPLNSSEILLKMERLNVLGTALYFAAHPDDENTKLIAYLASERKVRTAYLSLTRGDGGQNLIGTEQGVELGLIRTQELLQARGVDGGEQYFSSAYDFGFSKTHDETFRFWQKQEVLREAVWLIRKLQPDIIITRFPPDERGGHGHHQASAILAQLAYSAAADPKMFPDQLNLVSPWKATRLVWNTANFMRMQGSDGQLKIDIGAFNPLIGKSYGEISAISRSQHKSQGFGSGATNGLSVESFEHVDGQRATDDLFDAVDLSWRRVPNSENLQLLVDQLIKNYAANSPQKSIPRLAELWKALQKLQDGYWKVRKTQEVEKLLLACAGIKIESIADQHRVAQGESVSFNTEIIVRSPSVAVTLKAINKKVLEKEIPFNETLKLEASYTANNITQPYWLEKPVGKGKFEVEPTKVGFPMNPDLPSSDVTLLIEGISLTVNTPIQYRKVDPVRGEVYSFLEVVPQITASLTSNHLVKKGTPKTVDIQFTNNTSAAKQATIAVKLSAKEWKATPNEITLNFDGTNPVVSEKIQVESLASENIGNATLSLSYQGDEIKDLHQIRYDHIAPQVWFPPTFATLRPIELINPVERVAYIAGAGDLVPDALRNIGTHVDIIDVKKLSLEQLKNYQALIFGVRAMNVNPHIASKLPIVYEYVEQGGVVLMQYNVNSRLQKDNFGPKPFTISRARVTEEDAKVKFLNPSDRVWNYPNQITSKDFDGWVQERGLYFAQDIDPAYTTPLVMSDTGEDAHNGSLLILKLGKGKFVYTSLSFFRQLPAGVPGANRLFVNLLTK